MRRILTSPTKKRNGCLLLFLFLLPIMLNLLGFMIPSMDVFRHWRPARPTISPPVRRSSPAPLLPKKKVEPESGLERF